MTFQPEFKRPGLAIKAYLMAHNEATLTEIKASYTDRIKAVNKERRQHRQPSLRVPSYDSFYKYFKRCVRLGWLKRVRYQDAEWPVGVDPKTVVFPVSTLEGKVKYARGARVGVYRLTPDGVAEETGWLHPWKMALGQAPEPAPRAVEPEPNPEPAEKKRRKPVATPPEPKPNPPVEAGPDYAAIIEELKGILDEEKKAASIKKLWGQMNRYSLSEDELVGFDDVESAINEYQDIEKTGLTPEEYRDEKADAWETLVDAVEALEPAEEE